MSTAWLRAACVPIGLALCALACATPPSEEEIDAELRRIAAGVKPLAGELRCVPLSADSRMDAWAKLAESTAEGQGGEPNQQVRRLARALSYGEKRRVAVVTGGPYASLNERIVLDAFDAARAKSSRLAGLTLLFVSPDPPSPELRAAVSRAGSLLVHRAPPER